jgi:hypothetical protein
MKPLVESLFDSDLVQQGVPINIDYVYEEVFAALKKYNFEDCPYEKLNTGYVPSKDIIMPNSHSDYFSFTVLRPNYKIKSYASGRFGTAEEVLTGISFVIGTDDLKDDDTSVYLLRADVHWVDIVGGMCFSTSRLLWSGNDWEHYSKLKTNKITSETLGDIIDYIKSRIDKCFQMVTRDRQEIYNIKFGQANNGGDPWLKGRKDNVWYLEKMKKGLRR